MVKLPENLLNIARNHYTMVREIGNAHYKIGEGKVYALNKLYLS